MVVTCRKKKIVSLAYAAGGQVFGGYVREHVVPHIMGVPVVCEKFKDIDIWFRTEKQYQKFVSAMSELYTGFEPELKRHDGYPFECYESIVGTIETIDIDIVVSEHFPGGDFDVCSLTYSLESGFQVHKPVIGFKHGQTPDEHYGTCDSVYQVIGSILQKKATIFPAFYERSTTKTSTGKRARLRIDKMKSLGYTITRMCTTRVEV